MTVEYVYDEPSRSPQESRHWKALPEDGAALLGSLEEVKLQFQKDLVEAVNPVALWSCILGYCEALTTNKNDRFSIYPIPYSALLKLVYESFTPPDTTGQDHRTAARTISNWVWNSVKQKSNVKDELHANSVYTILKPHGKSVDCFGAALVTVIGLRQSGRKTSALTLSEDHAYESHLDNDGERHTCEVAVPGNTKEQRSKRGREVGATFRDSSRLTPETSWLYMGKAPVICDTDVLIMAAAVSNVNANIVSRSTSETYSRPLLLLKRELLWALYDTNVIQRFPFALCELGWSEEHVTSSRGSQSTTFGGDDMTTMEALYHEAILCSKEHYFDQQVYPYCYLGYFHKDAVEEYRAALAVAAFAEAASVASSYPYEVGDSLQLTKVMSTVATYIVREVLSCNNQPREWNDFDSAVAAAHQLAHFFDHLLAWEERVEEQFLPILRKNHKSGIASAFALISPEVRQAAYSLAFVETLGSHRIKRIPLSQAEKLSISDEAHLSLILGEKRPSRKRLKRN